MHLWKYIRYSLTYSMGVFTPGTYTSNVASCQLHCITLRAVGLIPFYLVLQFYFYWYMTLSLIYSLTVIHLLNRVITKEVDV